METDNLTWPPTIEHKPGIAITDCDSDDLRILGMASNESFFFMLGVLFEAMVFGLTFLACRYLPVLFALIRNLL